MKLDFRQRLLATTLLVGAAGLLASPAFAQDAPPPAPAPDEAPAETTAPVEATTPPSTSAVGEPVEDSADIVVTGSRIPQPNLTSASPVTVLTATEIKLQGTTRTEDLINSLPQSFAAQGSNISNGATGTATVNLRGLGSARTLVLINGRRLMPGDPRSPVADINFVPSTLVKRVDVLTGGASSVYGADAVAGVVNFIMDTTFTGLRIDGQASVFNHQNGGTSGDVKDAIDSRGFPRPKGMSTNGGAVDISVAFGTGFDDNRGHIMGYATYRKQNPVLQSTRDYSACALSATSPSQQAGVDPDGNARNGRRFDCGGSQTSAAGTFFTSTNTFFVQGNQFIEGSVPYNFAPTNFYQRPDERYTFGVFAEYEISDYAKPYLEAMYMDDQSVAQIAPSGDFFNTNTINCDNPLLSAQQVAAICTPANTFVDANGVTQAIAYIGRRNVEGGGRQDDMEHIAYRIVGGVRGDLHRGLSYDASYQFGKTILARTYLNDFSVTKLGRALDVVDDPSLPGIQPVCRSVLDGTDPSCVPWNIFSDGGVTQEALDYLQTPGFLRGDVQETVAQLNFTLEGGEYGFQFPWSDRGVGINVGAEYRKEKLHFDVDEAFESGDLAGQGGATIGVEGQFDVKDLYGEIQVPIISNSFIDELTFSAGYRYSAYATQDRKFSTDTYKVALEFAPIKDIRFRGSYNRAVRAPNIVELFSAQALGLAGSVDQCAGAVPTATLAQCQLTGVTPAQYGTINPNAAAQYQSYLGGNPDLSPETADSYTLGVVLQPRFIPGLAVTVDGFDIKVVDLISTIGFNTILTQCLNTGDPFFCSRVHRNTTNGSLWQGTDLDTAGYIVDINTNTGGLKTRGIDVNASYARQMFGAGTLNASIVGTWLDKLVVNPTADIKYDCAGFFGGTCGTPNPEWRHKARVGFTFRNGIGISAQWRYFSKVEVDQLSDDDDLQGRERGTNSPTDNGTTGLYDGNRSLAAQSYFDLALSAKIKDQLNLRIGANNIFDRDPPVAGSQVVGAGFGNGNTYPQVYDSLGRYLFAGFTVDF